MTPEDAENRKGRKVLVTDGGGFIGSHLAGEFPPLGTEGSATIKKPGRYPI